MNYTQKASSILRPDLGNEILDIEGMLKSLSARGDTVIDSPQMTPSIPHFLLPMPLCVPRP